MKCPFFWGGSGDLSEQCLAYLSSNKDEGSADERIQWAVDNGVIRESECPYDGDEDGRNSIPDLTYAQQVAISGEYTFYPAHRYDALDKVKEFVQSGNPVIVDVYTMGDAWDSTGIMELPTLGEINAACVVDFKSGGKKCKKHSVIVTGFDDHLQYLEFKNSWGQKWPPNGPLKGSGYGKMSYKYFQKTKIYGSQLVSKW